jgi:hypothetical protein
MSKIKVNSLEGVGASTPAITIDNASGTCTANVTNNLSNRNLIINGAMQVNVHSDGNAGVNNTFAVDRFKFKRESTAANFSMVQSSTSPDGFSKSLKIDCTAADTSTASNEFVLLSYSIEAQDLQQLGYGTSAAKPLVLSFYVRSNLTGTYGFSCIQIDNSNKIYGRSYTINSADTWERKTITIPADTSGVIDDNNGEGLQINFGLTMGSTFTSGSVSTAWEAYSNSKFAPQHGVNVGGNTSNEWLITGVQLEVDHTGSGKPTDFEHRSFGQELALCQRYYHKLSSSDNKIILFADYNNSTNNFWANITLPVTMRAAPTLSYAGFEGGAQTSVDSSSTSKHYLNLQVSNGATYIGNSTTVEASAEF